jgi:uncharacterized C2H2 Zn-finger protein
MSCPSDEVFRNIDDWMTHIISVHLQDSERGSCPLCMEQMGADLLPVIQHLRRHLEEISLSSLPVGEEWHSSSDSSSVTADSKEYEVDDILDERPNPDVPGSILYLVKWKDPLLPNHTWEPEENLSRESRDLWEAQKTSWDVEHAKEKNQDDVFEPMPAYPAYKLEVEVLVHSKSSSQNVSVDVHASSPSVVPPSALNRYICKICNKGFSRPSSLHTHSYSHTGEKPFKCPHTGCGRAFSIRSNWERHERGCHSFNANNSSLR